MRVWIVTWEEPYGGGAVIEGVFKSRPRAQYFIDTWYAKDHKGKHRADLFLEEHEVR